MRNSVWSNNSAKKSIESMSAELLVFWSHLFCKRLKNARKNLEYRVHWGVYHPINQKHVSQCFHFFIVHKCFFFFLLGRTLHSSCTNAVVSIAHSTVSFPVVRLSTFKLKIAEKFRFQMRHRHERITIETPPTHRQNKKEKISRRLAPFWVQC